MQEFVEDRGRHRLGGATLGVVQLCAVELGRPDLLGTRPQRRDRRDNVERGLPGAEAVRLLRDDFFRSFGLATPIGERLGNDGLEIVDVVEITTVELVDLRVEVPRNGEIDQEQRTALARRKRALYRLPPQRPAG